MSKCVLFQNHICADKTDMVFAHTEAKEIYVLYKSFGQNIFLCRCIKSAQIS